ncbi:hypothetical protein [Dysgonomonas macrotermitis]|uniref:Uncharacterized protein n=1 Tax=Dysgonomonas macrotermitis TaxID=1346286 RepID=A0A1M5GLZ5_9BACT|nr:hypothetical protein [Dysgonomonas macrotermitis]SHG04706.1 hypothetical protein SAMN05444362_11459 [Dysgonomonas macrotermitis]
MKKEVIYQNKALITFTLSGYHTAVSIIQKEVDALKDTGLKINDDILLDLMFNSGLHTKELAERQINEEAGKFALTAMKSQFLEQMQPLLSQIETAQSNVKAAMHVSGHSHSATLNADHFIIKDLRVSLVDDLEHIITDAHTNYADTPDKIEVLKRAKRLKQEIEDFEAFLRSRGDVLHPVGGVSIWGGALYAGDILLVNTKGGKCNIAIQPHVIDMLYSKQPHDN